MANAFDKIAKKKEPAASKSTKIAALVTDEVKIAVDRVIQIKFFGTKRVASLKSDVLKDDKLVNKIIDVLTKAGIYDIFEVTDTIIGKDDLDRKQYDLDKTKLETFRTLVRQKKASLKY